MRTLGDELISSETVAVIELVKNAYDADATRVLIRFVGSLKRGEGSIEIIDNGHGMSLAVIKSAWMEPATYNKRSRTRSEKLERRVLGEKGIGRFAASRLAYELELITRRSSARQEIYAHFDWKQFDDATKYLDEIHVTVEERTPKEICSSGIIHRLWTEAEKRPAAVTHGTILRMNSLKQDWTTSELSDLQRGLSRLVSPLFKHADFDIILDLPDEFDNFSQEIAPPKIISFPHYSIRGSVDSDGRYSFKIKVGASGEETNLRGAFRREGDSSEILMLEKKQRSVVDNPELASPVCGPLQIELRIWDRDELGNVEQATGSTLRDVRRDLDSIAGINIYRDNFRVLPYGEPQDDWLRLDIRRVQNPTHRLSNNQIVGYIRISADENPELCDQSNREGLDENQALRELREIMIAILTKLEEVRYKNRPRSEKQSRTPVTGLFTTLDLKPIRERLVASYPHDTEMLEAIDKTTEQLDKQLDEIQTVIGRYQRLATLGQLIDVVLHDGRQPVTKIVNEALQGREEIEDSQGRNGALLPGLRKRFSLIETQGNVLSTVFRRMEPFGGRRRGRPAQLYLEGCIADAFAVFQTEIKRQSVKVKLPQTRTLVRVDEAEIQEVIANLLQNSLYWLQHVDKNSREIVVTVARPIPKSVEIIFADSGPGIHADNRELIFEPYFSTKPSGVGLGLTIAGEIVSDYYDGTLELLEEGPLEGAVFRIVLRKRV